jgi:hypothetical protein
MSERNSAQLKAPALLLLLSLLLLLLDDDDDAAPFGFWF